MVAHRCGISGAGSAGSLSKIEQLGGFISSPHGPIKMIDRQAVANITPHPITGRDKSTWEGESYSGCNKSNLRLPASPCTALQVIRCMHMQIGRPRNPRKEGKPTGWSCVAGNKSKQLLIRYTNSSVMARLGRWMDRGTAYLACFLTCLIGGVVSAMVPVVGLVDMRVRRDKVRVVHVIGVERQRACVRVAEEVRERVSI